MPSPSNLPLIIFLLYTLFIHHSPATAQKCHVDDENGLLGFKLGLTSDPSGLLDSWQPGTDCCTWAAITCEPESDEPDSDNRVTTIILYGSSSEGKNILSGPISSTLSKLQYLKTFMLADLGNLTGPFPDFLFKTPSITTVMIRNCKLSSPIPTNIGDLTTLENLVLAGNQFSGMIPTSLSLLTRLVHLNLGNNLLSGSIPSSFRMLANLLWLELSWNQLTGSIPDIFSEMNLLEIVYLSNNNLSGTIPISFFSLSQPIIVDLSRNALTGQIPEISDKFSSVNQLNLSWNQLSGAAPMSFVKLVSITSLDVSHNKLNGSFPEMRLQTMYALDLSYNDYHFGKIPKWIGNTSVSFLNLAKCGIKMKLSDWKPTANIYGHIDLSENKLTGNPLQLLINQSMTLTEFRASDNRLGFNMTHMKLGKKMEKLDLSNNLVFGNVPKTVSRLKELNVSRNHLCGPLPVTKFPPSSFLENDCLCGAPLQPRSQFSGKISSLAKLTRLKDPGLSGLTGEILGSFW